MDPIKIRAAFGLPATATDDELYAAMAHDPDPMVPAVRDAYAAYDAQRHGAGTAPVWMTLESRDVSRTALSLLEFWALSSLSARDMEGTKILCMDTLGVLPKLDVMRVATAVAAMAVHMLITDEQRPAALERLALEIALLVDAPERS